MVFKTQGILKNLCTRNILAVILDEVKGKFKTYKNYMTEVISGNDKSNR